MKSLSLILPVWNEETFIADVVQKIAAVLEDAEVDYELLLVENGSTDRSLEILQSLARKNSRLRAVVRPKGYGSAVIGGLVEARKEIVGYMPSDGQIDPAVLPSLLKKFDGGEYDLVKISRVERESFTRRLLSLCFNLTARFLFNVNVKDINGSPKLFSRHYVSLLSLQSIRNLIDLEFMAKVKVLGWRIYEYPIRSLSRAGGKSHVNLAAIVEFVHEMIRLLFSKELCRFRQGSPPVHASS